MELQQRRSKPGKEGTGQPAFLFMGTYGPLFPSMLVSGRNETNASKICPRPFPTGGGQNPDKPGDCGTYTSTSDLDQRPVHRWLAQIRQPQNGDPELWKRLWQLGDGPVC